MVECEHSHWCGGEQLVEQEALLLQPQTLLAEPVAHAVEEVDQGVGLGLPHRQQVRGEVALAEELDRHSHQLFGQRRATQQGEAGREREQQQRLGAEDPERTLPEGEDEQAGKERVGSEQVEGEPAPAGKARCRPLPDPLPWVTSHPYPPVPLPLQGQAAPPPPHQPAAAARASPGGGREPGATGPAPRRLA